MHGGGKIVAAVSGCLSGEDIAGTDSLLLSVMAFSLSLSQTVFVNTRVRVSLASWALFVLQGKQVEMCDEDYEPANGHGYRGIIQGTMIACLCGCEATMKGAERGDAVFVDFGRRNWVRTMHFLNPFDVGGL